MPKADSGGLDRAARQLASLVTSSLHEPRLPPPAVILSAVWRPSASSTSATMTLAPSRANSIASLCPMPLAPPLTMATLSFSLYIASWRSRPTAGERSTSPNTLWDNAGQMRGLRFATVVTLLAGTPAAGRAGAGARGRAQGPRRAAQRGRLDRPGRDLLAGAPPGDRARVAHVLDEPRATPGSRRASSGRCRTAFTAGEFVWPHPERIAVGTGDDATAIRTASCCRSR